MERIVRVACAATLALSAAVAMTVAPTAPASAADAYPKPMSREWWFTTWEIENKVWPVSQGQGVTVAVLDTGVQAGIPELSGVVLPGIDETGGGGDGRTDTDDAGVPGHGTAMAALIAAQGGPTGYLGVAPKAKILPVTVHSSSASNVPGIHYAVDHGAQVINISQSASLPCPDDLQRAVSYAIEHDVVIVAAAGNNGDEANENNTPANCAGVLAVGAVGVSGQRFVPWEKTQRQPYVAVGAPGVDVGGILKDGRFHPGNGSSSAAALTSAAAALVRSKYPKMPAREVVRRIIASCRDVSPPGRDDRTGYGLVRPVHALKDTVPKGAPNPVFAAYDKWKAGTGDRGPHQPETTTPSSHRRPSLSILFALVLLIVVFGVFRLVRKARRRPAVSGSQGPTPYPSGYGQGPPGPAGFQQPPPQQPGPPQGGWPQPPSTPPAAPPGQPPVRPPGTHHPPQ